MLVALSQPLLCYWHECIAVSAIMPNEEDDGRELFMNILQNNDSEASKANSHFYSCEMFNY